jgi:hypothetical protein
LLAYDPEKISLVRHAFDHFHWPIADFPSSAVSLAGELGEGPPARVLETIRQPVVHPIGWRDAAAEWPSGQSGSRGASGVQEAAPVTSEEVNSMDQWDA